MLKAFSIGSLVLALAVGASYFRHQIGDLIYSGRDTIVAEVTLDNRCTFKDFVFVVRDLDTGHYAAFHGNRAKLRTTERNRVRLEFAPRFKKVTLYAPEVPVSAQTTLVARCRSRSFFDLFWQA